MPWPCDIIAFSMKAGAQNDRAPAMNATQVKPNVENIKLLLQTNEELS